MTKEEILAMEPGKELDLEIALKVIRIAPYKAEPYSTDILAAWQVKEKLNSEGLLLTLIDLCPSGKSLCMAAFWGYMGLVPTKMFGKAEAEEAPEAICKAALLAKLGRH